MSRTPLVQTQQGPVKGTKIRSIDKVEYFAFNGIPYAEPPIGDLRFKDPRPPKPRGGVLDLSDRVTEKATQYDSFTKGASGSEDCLYLHIATKSLVGKRPVMFWIHGGGYSVSTGGTELYGPDYLVPHDVVVVSIEFRLGSLGFLNLGLPDASGNQGMKDLIAGLLWVRENIEAFGGDPENVTIFGESSGGSSVHLLTLSPLAKGLFHKAIIQSTVAISHWIYMKEPLEIGLNLASLVDDRLIDDPKEALDILMKASTDQLIKAQLKINPREMNSMVINFTPSVDIESLNPFMPEHPIERYKQGIHVPLIIGSTSEEGILVLGFSDEDMYKTMNDDFGGFLSRDLGTANYERVAQFANDVRKFYYRDTATLTPDANMRDFIRMAGDLYAYNDLQKVVEIQSNLSTPTYLYRFSHVARYATIRMLMNNYIEGAGHGDEIGALFHSRCFMGSSGLKRGTKDHLVMERMTLMWTNFAKTGNPTVQLNDKLTTKWEPIAKDKKNYLDISERLVSSKNFGEVAWKFWKPLLESL